MSFETGFLHEPDPDHPGWTRWGFRDPTRFTSMLGPLRIRVEGDRVRLRASPERRHSNLGDHVHGGALLGLIDVALFSTARGLGHLEGMAVTLDLSTQFISAAAIDQPLDAIGEVLRATRRLIFIRGLVEQDGTVIASFTGTVRKLI